MKKTLCYLVTLCMLPLGAQAAGIQDAKPAVLELQTVEERVLQDSLPLTVPDNAPEFESAAETPLTSLEIPAQGNNSAAAQPVSHELVVGFYENGAASVTQIADVLTSSQLSENVYLLQFSDETAAQSALHSLLLDPNVKYAEYNQPFTTDPVVPDGTEPEFSSDNESRAADTPNDYDRYSGQWYLDSIGAADAWDYLETVDGASSRTVTVAVLDSGVATNHADLKNRLARDNANNILGYNFVDNSTDVEDDNVGMYHGTQVAGIIAAEADNGVGICGVAGPYDVKIMPVKVSDSNGSSTLSRIISGIDFAIQNNADVITMSLSTTATTESFQDAISRAYAAGIPFIASAGNNYSSAYTYPSSAEYAISVGAMDADGQRSAFSQYNDRIDLVAPGSRLSTTTTNASGQSLVTGDAGTSYSNGTSFSTPMVAAAAALVKLAVPDIPPKEVAAVLKYSATDRMQEGFDIDTGFGSLNLSEAVRNSAEQPYQYVSRVTQDEKYIQLKLGECQQLDAAAMPLSAVNRRLHYTSSDTSIATVTSSGVVYAVSPGEVSIFVSADEDPALTEDVKYTVQVYPGDVRYTNAGLDLGKGSIKNMPVLDYDEFLLAGDTAVRQVRYEDGKIKISGSGVSVKNAYDYAEVMPKNKGTARDVYSYALASNSGTIIFSANAQFRPNAALTLPNWGESSKITAFASDGAAFSFATTGNRLYHLNVNDPDLTPDTISPIATTYQFTALRYITDGSISAYLGAAVDDDGKTVLGLSTYGGKNWAYATKENEPKLENIPQIKRIVNDKDLCYLLCDNAVYYTRIVKTSSGGLTLGSPVKLCDIDGTKIKDIALYTYEDSNLLAGFGGDNYVYGIFKSGDVFPIASVAAGQTIEQVFNYKGVYFAICDGNLMQCSFPRPHSLSTLPELRLFGTHLLDGNGRHISSMPTGGKVTLEFYMDSTAPISFTNSFYNSKGANNKYPLQLVTSVYDKQKGLVAVSSKDFMMDYTSAGPVHITLNQTFDLPEGGDYTLKSMVIRGNHYYWPQSGDEAYTLTPIASAMVHN